MKKSILQCQQLMKRYSNTFAPALNKIDLEIGQGKIVGLLGPNGSGKTTIIKLANGLIQPTSGSITINGMAPGPITKAKVSYLPEKDSLPEWMQVKDAFAYYKDFFENFDEVKAAEMLKNLKIEKGDRLRSMSKGTREKVQLILAMSRKADLYLLDEPIGGVDPAARDYILDTIISNYSENATVLISTHLVADIEKVLDEVIMINMGEVVLHAGIDEIRAEKGKSVDALFREVFKC